MQLDEIYSKVKSNKNETKSKRDRFIIFPVVKTGAVAIINIYIYIQIRHTVDAASRGKCTTQRDTHDNNACFAET